MQDFGHLIISHYNYIVSIILMMIGFYGVINGTNLIKKLISLGVFQTSVLLLYVSLSVIEGGHIPVLEEGDQRYTNPLPHVLMLTAIVVGVATLAVGLAIAVRIREAYHTIEEDDILAMDKALSRAAMYEHLELEAAYRRGDINSARFNRESDEGQADASPKKQRGRKKAKPKPASKGKR